MNFEKLQEQLSQILQDDSLGITASLGDYINEALGQIAEETNPPTLKETFTVNTELGVAFTDLPARFSGKLTYAGTEAGPLEIVSEVEVLLRKYPALAEVGPPASVVVENTHLYYQPIPPAVTTITCVGYMLPTLLVAVNDVPTFIPEYLHREVIAYKAAVVAFNLIEDGIDGRKVNMEANNSLYQIGLAKLLSWVRARGKRGTHFKYYI